MKKQLIFFVLIAFALGTLAFTFTSDKPNGFYGAKKCGMCHKKEADGAQLKKWQESKHANATESLKTAEADKLAGGKAMENMDCLKCHATGAGSDPAHNNKKFKIDGVQCEACHGPGTNYKSKKVMEDREKSIANGLIVWANEKEIEAMCLTCHAMDLKPEGHVKGEWDFPKMYSAISHKKPAAK